MHFMKGEGHYLESNVLYINQCQIPLTDSILVIRYTYRGSYFTILPPFSVRIYSESVDFMPIATSFNEANRTSCNLI